MSSNKDLVYSYLKSYENNQENVNRFLHPLHEYYPPGGGKAVKLDERVRDEAFFFSAFSDIRIDVGIQIAEGDKVASRISMDCLHTGKYMGLSPTRKRINIFYISIVQLKDGKILKEWAEFDMGGILSQIQ
jgi:predicted ester cyclase